MKQAVIGIDIGGTKIAAHISDGTLASQFERTIAVPAPAKPSALAGIEHNSPEHQAALLRGREAMLHTIVELCRALINEAQQAHITILAVGIGSTGQVNPHLGMVVDANPNIVGWTGTKIAESIHDALQIPVYVENDVRVMALAETTLGAGKDYEHVLCITVGTGIGGALVLNKHLWHGANFSAGEIGYVYAGNGETIETLYAGPSIARRYNQQHNTDYSLRDIANLAHDGDETCIFAIRDAAENLGKYFAPIIGLIDPQAVVIGGGVPDIGDLWWQAFRQAIRRFYLKSVQETPLLLAELGNRAGMIGASVLAMQKENKHR